MQFSRLTTKFIKHAYDLRLQLDSVRSYSLIYNRHQLKDQPLQEFDDEQPCAQTRGDEGQGHKLNMALLNARSCRNKTSKIAEFVVGCELDVAAVTETWLRPGEVVPRRKLTPPGYLLLDVPRGRGRKGGGVGVLLNENSVTIEKHVPLPPQLSYECLQLVLAIGASYLTVIVVYRPPGYGKHSHSTSVFLEEFSDHMQEVRSTERLLILGDFNFHFEKSSGNAKKFRNLLQTFDLVQHVRTPTHKSGHILDLVMSRVGDFGDVAIHNHGPILSDHDALTFQIPISISDPPAEPLSTILFNG
jgi:hypothetical protein